MTLREGLVGPTPYETWVRTMQAWSADPTTPLEHLPPLADDTYSPQTYQRLLRYIMDAVQAATDRWQRELERALSTWRDSHDLARQLVQLRASLARRVQLSSHPSLPPGIRTALMEDATRSIRRYQSELEDGVRRSLASSNASRSTQEDILRVVRENPFSRTLDVQVTQTGDRQQLAPLPLIDSSQTPVQPRFGHRRLFPS